MKKNLHALLSKTGLFLAVTLFSFSSNAQNLLTVSPSFEEGSNSGPGSSLNGGAWARFNTGNSTPVQNILYRKTENPAPQHLTAYAEVVTPNEPGFNSPSTLQTQNQQNLTSALTNGVTYRVSFYYQNTAGHTFRTTIGNSNGTGGSTATQLDITTEATTWTYASFDFVMNSTTLNDARLKFQFGSNAGTTRIDNVMIQVASTMPVKFATFSGVLIKDGAELNWQTASESNNDRFEIERSADARTFDKIGSVASKAEGGNSSNLLSYSFLDKEINFSTTTTLYYRLKQVDKDGKRTYSSVMSVNLKDIKTTKLSVFPNPVVDHASLNFKTFEKGNVSIRITSINGKVMLTQKASVVAGSNIIQLNGVNKLASGIYKVDIFNNGDNTIIGSTTIIK